MLSRDRLKSIGLKSAAVIDALSAGAFLVAGACLFLLVILTVQQVVARYFFQASSVAFQELEWHLFGAAVMLSMAYTMRFDGHVRVDFLYTRFPSRMQKTINFVGLLALIPTCLYLAIFCFEFALDSYQIQTTTPNQYIPWFIRGEGSPDPGGLPARWIIQSTIPLGFVLVALQACSLLLRLSCGEDGTKRSSHGT